MIVRVYLRWMMMLFAMPAFAAETYTFDQVIPEAKKSIYSDKVFRPLKKWPPKELPEIKPGQNPVWVRAIRTPGQDLYIGTEKLLLIHAPITAVTAALEDFDSYSKIFQDVEQVKVIAKDGNKLTVFWERNSPAFFIPNVKYDMMYIIQHLSEKRVVYRYQLKKGNSLNFSDGIIVLDADGDSTKVTGIDFYDASWGILGGIAKGKIWRASLEGGYKADIAFKAHLEHPEWKSEQLTKESERMLDQFPVEPIQYVDQYDWE